MITTVALSVVVRLNAKEREQMAECIHGKNPFKEEAQQRAALRRRCEDLYLGAMAVRSYECLEGFHSALWNVWGKVLPPELKLINASMDSIVDYLYQRGVRA